MRCHLTCHLIAAPCGTRGRAKQGRFAPPAADVCIRLMQLGTLGHMIERDIEVRHQRLTVPDTNERQFETILHGTGTNIQD